MPTSDGLVQPLLRIALESTRATNGADCNDACGRCLVQGISCIPGTIDPPRDDVVQNDPGCRESRLAAWAHLTTASRAGHIDADRLRPFVDTEGDQGRIVSR